MPLSVTVHAISKTNRWCPIPMPITAGHVCNDHQQGHDHDYSWTFRRLFPWRVTARDDAAGDSNVLSDMEAGQGPAQHAEPVGADRRTQPLSESSHQCTPAAARQANGAVPSSPGAGESLANALTFTVRL